MLYTQLRSFHAVAAAGGFTAASRVLNIGQPTITSQVKALEVFYDVELFHRRGRTVELTEPGRALLQLTRRIMTLEGEADGLLKAFGGFQTGEFHVGAVGPYHATEMLSAFSERYPGIKLSVTVGNSRVMVQQLIDYTADVAVLAHVEDDPRVHAMPYSRHPVIVFVNKDHRFARRRRVRIEELHGERMVLREVGSATRLAFETALDAAGVVVDPVMEIGSREAVWLAVARGIGIGVVSEFEFIPHPDLHTVEFSDVDVHTTAHVNCLQERRQSPLVGAFLDVAAALRDVRDTLPAVHHHL